MHDHKNTRFLLAAFVAVAGCSSAIDRSQEASSLLQTDRDFAAYSVENGAAEAFREYLVADALQLPNQAAPIQGRSDIVGAMLAAPSFGLDWIPQHAEVASAGDMGWTWGTYTATFADSAGNEVSSEGKYLNVWRNDVEHGWRVVVDMGNGSES